MVPQILVMLNWSMLIAKMNYSAAFFVCKLLLKRESERVIMLAGLGSKKEMGILGGGLKFGRANVDNINDNEKKIL